MNENDLWEIESFNSENAVKRTEMTLKKGNSKLVLYSLTIPASWSVGDEVGDFKLREDAGPGYVSLSNKSKDRANKPKEGPIQARVIDDPDDFMKSLRSAERMEYPNLGEDKAQKITKKEPPKIWLEDQSRWYFYPTTSPLPEEWAIGDPIVVEHAGAFREGDKTINYNLKNMRLKKDYPYTPNKYEQSAFWENPEEMNSKSYDAEKGMDGKRKGPISDRSVGEYAVYKGEFNKFGEVLKIDKITEEFILIGDDGGSWPFHWHSVIGHHGEWKRGDRVKVTKNEKMVDSKAYSLENLETGKFLTITPVKENDEE